MSPKLKYHRNSNDKKEISPKLTRHQNWNITKTEMSPKVISHQNWNVTKSEMSPKLKFHQNWVVTKTEVSSKLKRYQNWNVTKHYNVLKNQSQNSRDRHWIPWSCFVTTSPKKGVFFSPGQKEGEPGGEGEHGCGQEVDPQVFL